MKAWFEDLPLDFTRMETRTAERLLIAGFPINMAAVTLAQDAGLDLALLNQMAPVKFLVRDMLVKARQSDRLTQLLAEVLRDPPERQFIRSSGRWSQVMRGPLRRRRCAENRRSAHWRCSRRASRCWAPGTPALSRWRRRASKRLSMSPPALPTLPYSGSGLQRRRCERPNRHWWQGQGDRIPDRGQSPAHELACRQRRRRGRCRCVRQQGLSSRKGRTGSRTRCGVCIELVGCTQRA